MTVLPDRYRQWQLMLSMGRYTPQNLRLGRIQLLSVGDHADGYGRETESDIQLSRELMASGQQNLYI